MDSRNHITDQVFFFFCLPLERADSYSTLCKALFLMLLIITNLSNTHSTTQVLTNKMTTIQ